jgi:hypothetical protein
MFREPGVAAAGGSCAARTVVFVQEMCRYLRGLQVQPAPGVTNMRHYTMAVNYYL